MAGRPKLGRLLVALQRRADGELGEHGSILDYVVGYVAAGGFLSSLANDLAAELGESVSRPFLSGAVHALAPNAKERIEAARREGAAALAEQATAIADKAPETTGGVAKARLQADARRWMAERFDPATFGTSNRTEVSLNWGQLHLDALRHANALARDAKAKATLVPAVIEEETADETPE